MTEIVHQYECPYCGGHKPSSNGTGSDVPCCGEVGHSEKVGDYIDLLALPKDDPMGEGYLLTTGDRMYWDNVYESLSQGEPK